MEETAQGSLTNSGTPENLLLIVLEELKKQHKETTESRDAIRKELCDLRTVLAKDKGQSKENSLFFVLEELKKQHKESIESRDAIRKELCDLRTALAKENWQSKEESAVKNEARSSGTKRGAEVSQAEPPRKFIVTSAVGRTELLSDADGTKHLQDERGFTALHLAAKNGYVGLIEKLLNAGASTRIPDRHYRTQLHVALELCEEAAAELLSDADGMNCLQDEEGRTPLHLAAKRGYVGVVKKLLSAGASTRIKDRHHRTPLHVALESREKEAAELLSDADSNICLQDVKGRSPLHLALEAGYDSIARRLLYSLAHTPLVDNGNLPPLSIFARITGDGRRRLLLLLVQMASLKKTTVVWDEMTDDPGDRVLCSSLAAECDAEVRRMRETSVPGSSASFYDVARRPAGWVAARLRGDGFRETLREGVPFPRYAALIRFRAAAADRRRILEDRCLRRFALLDRRLPKKAVDGIIAYLTERDMQNFATAFVREA